MANKDQPELKKKIFKPITTAHRIPVTPVEPDRTAEESATHDKRAHDTGASSWFSAQASKASMLPRLPKLVAIKDGPVFATGCYVMAAPTGSGKTVLSMALTAMINAADTPASYFCVYEPGAPASKTGTAFSTETAGDFLDDIEATTVTSAQSKVLIFDSCTLPIKAFGSKRIFSGQPTYKEGSQPSDRAFLTRADQIAVAKNAVFIMLLNSTLIPYVASFEGAIQGLLRVKDIAHFTYTGRFGQSRRKEVPIAIPIQFIQPVLDYFDYGTYEPSVLDQRGIIGL
jgi:hypothetical protein